MGIVHVEPGRVGVVEIQRPPENYIDLDVVRGVADALDELRAGGSRVAVLASEGKHFCAGVDFAVASIGDDRMARLYDEALRLFAQPLPIVCAVQGAAIGGGLGLALVGDFRVAAPEARFSANFARLGFHHGFGLSVTLPRLVGEQAALDLLYTGRRVGGEEAVRLGLADKLVPLDEVRSAAIAYADEIATSAPLAVQSVRVTMRGDLGDRVRAALDRERAEQERLQQTADFKEGIAASGERRTPDFIGA